MIAEQLTREGTVLEWGNGLLRLRLTHGMDQPVVLEDIMWGVADAPARTPKQTLVEILIPSLGLTDTPNRMDKTALGARLRYRAHSEERDADTLRLIVEQHDDVIGLIVVTVFETVEGAAAFRTRSVVSLEPGRPAIRIAAVSSFATGAILSDDLTSLKIWRARSSWSAENRWEVVPLRDPAAQLIAPHDPAEYRRGFTSATSFGTWSSGSFAPAAVAVNSVRALAWQVDSPSPWRWEVGERAWDRSALPRFMEPEPIGQIVRRDIDDGAYLVVSGPTDDFHQWTHALVQGDAFESVTVSVGVGQSTEDALAGLTEIRRAWRRMRGGAAEYPVIYNDFMGTLEGDPTEEKLLPLIESAARVGADYFCIDAGWADNGEGWADSVGDWNPSVSRFPRGISTTLDAIRARGMKPGLWLEPEVVGETSDAAIELPEEAFLHRFGGRIRDRGRFYLDFRSSAATRHLDRVLDRLVVELGVCFFKFDYNSMLSPGPDGDGGSAGGGLLENARAHVAWLARLRQRHPDVLIENCASGGMRSDFGILENVHIQSTSDQPNPLLYPSIAVGALAHILPEQAGNWSYPQADMTDEMICFTIANGLAGRLYLAGVLSRMDDRQLELVAAGVSVHKRLIKIQSSSIVRYPTGMARWGEPWSTVAFDNAESGEVVVIVWRQSGADPAVVLEIGVDDGATVEQVFPPPEIGRPWTVELKNRRLFITGSGDEPAARVYLVTKTVG